MSHIDPVAPPEMPPSAPPEPEITPSTPQQPEITPADLPQPEITPSETPSEAPGNTRMTPPEPTTI